MSMNCEQMKFVENSRITMMSLRQEYFEQILKGEKTFEYRKKYYDEKSVAYIYVSKTQKEIVGKVWFGKPIIDDSEKIAQIAEKDQPGSYNNIKEYLGKNRGYAIPIEKVELVKKISLKEIKEVFADFVPPQSYYYLDNKKQLLDFLIERTSTNE